MSAPNSDDTQILDDLAAAQRAIDGDTQMFQALMSAIHEDITAFWRSRVPQELRATLTADDIANETCLRFQERVKGTDFRFEKSARRYARTIAKNLLNDAGRRHKPQVSIYQPVSTSTKLHDALQGKSNDPATPTLNREMAEQIDSVLTSREEVDECIFEMRFEEDLPWAEIAKRIGLSESRTRVRFNNALAAIRKRLRTTGILTPAPTPER